MTSATMSSLHGFQSALPINGTSSALPGGVPSSLFLNGSSSGDPSSIWSLPPPGQAGSGQSSFGYGMPAALTSAAELGTVSSLPYGGASFGSSPYMGPGSYQPPAPVPRETTPAFERAAAALSAQVASGGSFALNMEGEGMENPFEGSLYGSQAALAQGNYPFPPVTAAPDVYRQPSDNREVMIQTLQSLQAKEQAASCGPQGFGAPLDSQYSVLPSSAFAGSATPGGAYDNVPPKGYVGYGGASAGYEETVASLQAGSMQPYRQPSQGSRHSSKPSQSSQQRGMPSTGVQDGRSHSGAGSSMSGKQPNPFEDFSFPKTGSFVATPYDDDGTPAYYDTLSRPAGAPMPYDAIGTQGMRPSEEDSRRVPASSSQFSTVNNAYDSYKAGGAAASPAMGYDPYAGGNGRMPANAYDYNLGGYGLPDARRGYDPGSATGASYSGSLTRDKGGPAGVGDPGMGGSALISSGSFVATPYAEGAPTLEMLPPTNAAPYQGYAPPPMPPSPPAPYAPPSQQSYSLLQHGSGSFVATPFADGAPTPDMLRGSVPGSPLPGGYPDAYPNSPPTSLGMYGGSSPASAMDMYGGARGRTAMEMYGGAAPLDMYGGALASPGLGFGAGGPSPFGPFTGFDPSPSGPSGSTPFSGFDSQVPGKSLATANYGPGPPQAGSFVAVPPPLGKEGGNGSGSVRFSDDKSDYPGTRMQPRTRATDAGQNGGPGDDRNGASKSQMERASRSRDVPPRTKKKGERRACC